MNSELGNVLMKGQDDKPPHGSLAWISIQRSLTSLLASVFVWCVTQSSKRWPSFVPTARQNVQPIK